MIILIDDIEKIITIGENILARICNFKILTMII